jgi:hypothetical protein
MFVLDEDEDEDDTLGMRMFHKARDREGFFKANMIRSSDIIINVILCRFALRFCHKYFK